MNFRLKYWDKKKDPSCTMMNLHFFCKNLNGLNRISFYVFKHIFHLFFLIVEHQICRSFAHGFKVGTYHVNAQ